ncbi:MAG TPA: phytoene/squalene synthase family protein [Chthoniobacterales bacterium]
MNAPTTRGEQITKASRSNLAFAFFALPEEQRREISIFYGFCRVVDDIADDPGVAVEERRRQLNLWRASLSGPACGEDPLAGELRSVLAKYRIDPALPREIIAGVEMDLDARRYETFEDLQLYCYRVAGAVGLVSIAIFGCHDPLSRDHAVTLGEALQLTNILRDVGEDYRNGRRIYLPLSWMREAGVTESDLGKGNVSEPFVHLMNRLATRAQTDYAQADRLITPGDRRKLLPGLMMRDIYFGVLTKMRHDGFRVFDKRYRLGKLGKMLAVAPRLMRSRFASKN